MTYQTGFETTIAFRVEPTDTTIKLATAPAATNGRIYIFNNAQEEWVSYTGVSGTTITGVTRGLSKTADPATAGTGLTWIAGTTVRLVAMHDQMPDKKDSNTFIGKQTFNEVDFDSTGKFSPPIYATTATRDAEITSPTNGLIVYVTADGSFYKYEAGAWSTFASGSVPNASTTAAGKVELGTSAEGKAGTATGGSGPLVLSPDVLADVVQSGAWLYAGTGTSGTDSYTVAMTPACTGYVTGMQISFIPDVDSTGPCEIKLNSLAFKNIKLIDGNDPASGQIKAGVITYLTYNGTNFVYIATPVIATNAEAETGTNTMKYVTPSQLSKYAGTVTAGTTMTAGNIVSTVGAAGATYVRAFGGTIGRAGTYTFTFTLYASGGAQAFGRIYKNGTAVGTERTTGSGTPQTYTENLTFAATDSMELKIKTNGIGAANSDGLSVKFDLNVGTTFSIT